MALGISRPIQISFFEIARQHLYQRDGVSDWKVVP